MADGVGDDDDEAMLFGDDDGRDDGDAATVFVTLGNALDVTVDDAAAVPVVLGVAVPLVVTLADTEPLAITDANGVTDASGHAPASTLETCAAVKAAFHTRTLAKPPVQGNSTPVTESVNGALPHRAAPPGMLCGGTKGAEDVTQTGAAESTYTLSVKGPVGVATGTADNTSVCQLPSAKFAPLTQSLEVPTV